MSPGCAWAPGVGLKPEALPLSAGAWPSIALGSPAFGILGIPVPTATPLLPPDQPL